jgi:hypothetical protein
MKPSEFLEGKDFSLVLGGPFFQLLKRVHLTGNALELIKKRIIIISMIAWFPLFLFSMLKRQAWGEGTNLPFIEDIEVHIRFLVAVPLLVLAELVVHQRLQIVVRQFQERDLIPETAKGSFHRAIASALRLRNAWIAEAGMMVLIYAIGYKVVWQQSMAVDTTAWFTEPAFGKGELSLAGIWFRYVSLPLFQFLFLRWFYRIFIWARFLFQVSRIKLNLVATHPDNAGGLGFLDNSVYAFMPLALVHGAVLAGMISNHIFHEGAALLDFKIQGIVILVWVLCLAIMPLFSFASQLSDVKRLGALEYGKLASHFVQGFDATFVKGKSVENSVIGSEIQSLSDLNKSYAVVKNMQIVPVTRSNIIMAVLITIVPVLPLLLTMMPLSELLKILAGFIF